MSFSFRLNFKVYSKITLLQFIILILLFQTISNYLDIFILFYFNILPGKFVYIVSLATLLLIYAPICLIHELLHTFAHKMLGGKPRIALKWIIYAYTMETSGRKLSRTELLIVLLVPMTVISLICMILSGDIFRMAFYLNLLGSCGDLYMSLWLCKVRWNTKILDKPYGFDVLSGFEGFDL